MAADLDPGAKNAVAGFAGSAGVWLVVGRVAGGGTIAFDRPRATWPSMSLGRLMLMSAFDPEAMLRFWRCCEYITYPASTRMAKATVRI